MTLDPRYRGRRAAEGNLDEGARIEYRLDERQSGGSAEEGTKCKGVLKEPLRRPLGARIVA